MRPDFCLRFAFVATLLVTALALVGCGDDATTSTDAGDDTALDQADDSRRGGDNGGDDAREDTTPDLVDEPDAATDATTDAGDDTEGDAVPDVSDEEVAPPVETECFDEVDDDEDGDVDCEDSDCDGVCEVCTDLLDNNEDGNIDCDDPLCSDDEACPELCSNEDDDDADGDVDCDDSECAEVPRCTETPVGPDDYEFSEQLSYFNYILYPPPGAPCCFDFTDDETPDNNLLTVLNLLPDYEAQLEMNAVVNAGDLGILIEWTELPEDLEAGGTANFNVFRAHPTAPEPIRVNPPTPEDNAWRDGNGTFQVTADSFDALGPRIRFRDAAVADGVLTGGPFTLNLTVPIDPLGLSLDVTLYGAQMEAAIQTATYDSGPDGLVTVPDDSGEVTLPGGRIGGYVLMDDILGFFNEAAIECGCATPFGSEHPLLTYGERATPRGYAIACNWSPLEPGDSTFSCGIDDSPLCDNLASMCTVLALAPAFLDVDSNRNQIKDALSAGLYFEMVRGQLDDPAVEPAE